MLEERRLVRTGWDLLAPQAHAFAERFLTRLVEQDPGLHVVLAVADGDPACTLVESLERVVSLLDEPDRLVERLIAEGGQLAKLGVGARDHDSARAALFGALADTLGDRFTPEMDEAWHELFAVVSAVTLRAGIVRPTPMIQGEGREQAADGGSGGSGGMTKALPTSDQRPATTAPGSWPRTPDPLADHPRSD